MDFRDSINAIGKIRCIMITPLFLCLKYYRVNLFIICVGDFPAIRIMPGHILNKKASCTIFQGIIFVMFQYGFQFPAVFTGFSESRPRFFSTVKTLM